MNWLSALVQYASSQVDDPVLESLNSRGVSDEQVRHFQIGALDQNLPDLEYPPEFLEWCQGGRKLDKVLVFPLTNVLGEIHGVQFRYQDRERKGYMDYFSSEKGEAVLFGLREAIPHLWRTGTVFLVEGVFDHLPAQRHVPVTLPTLTARVPESVLWLLKRVCKRVVFGYDFDNTGKAGVEWFRKHHKRDFDIEALKNPNLTMSNGKMAKDIGDLWELKGDAWLGSFLKFVNDLDKKEW